MRLVTGQRLFVSALAFAALAAWPAAASAQLWSQPSGLAIGEDYHVEAGITWWNPQPTLIVNSESLGILGTDVDLVKDLGIEQKRIPEVRLVLKAGRRNKFRINYLPLKYDADATVQREFVFNGQRYHVGLPVKTTADLTTWRLGYEFDFVAASHGFLGLTADLKYTDVDVSLLSTIGEEFTRQKAPIPTLGLIGRGYILPNVSITGEFSYMKVPDSFTEDFEGRYVDFDFYGTVNITNHLGAQLGYRSIDVFYQEDLDSGTLKFKGWYLAGVARF